MIQYRRSLSNHPAEGINLAELNGCDIVITGEGLSLAMGSPGRRYAI